MALREEFGLSEIFDAAATQMNALLAAGTLPSSFEGASLDLPGDSISDLNGSVLFQRVSLSQGGMPIGYADVGVDPAIGSPLISVAPGASWSGPALVQAARDVGSRRFGINNDSDASLVVYSFPKLAVRLDPRFDSPVLLEVGTWEQVPQRSEESLEDEAVENFEAWSFLDELGDAESLQRSQVFNSTVRELTTLREAIGLPVGNLLSSAMWRSPLSQDSTESRTLCYSPLDADHRPCIELRGQETNVWCVAASAQMLLDFYRYHYDQSRIAAELGLGTRQDPSGLSRARAADVVTALEALSSHALSVRMFVPSQFDEFAGEIGANRPLISFIRGHSRMIAGYTRTTSAVPSLSFEGLLVYDPSPPNRGVITQWENYAVASYIETYSAQLALV
jgi:hypothetical protein